jgi:hypothetical protein
VDEPATVHPTPQQSVDHLHDLIQMWEAHGESVTVPIIGGSLLAGMCIQVQVEHAIRLTEAVLLLVKQGLFIQVAPLSRMVMECAITAAWWTLNPDNVKGSAAEAARMKQMLIKGMASAAGTAPIPHADWADMAEQFDAYRSGEAHKFEQRCNALQGGAAVYTYYRLLSEASHGGTAILDEYLEQVPETPDNPFGYAFQRHAPYKYFDNVLAIHVLMLGYAMRAWDNITKDHPDSDALDALGDVLGSGLIISPAD